MKKVLESPAIVKETNEKNKSIKETSFEEIVHQVQKDVSYEIYVCIWDNHNKHWQVLMGMSFVISLF